MATLRDTTDELLAVYSEIEDTGELTPEVEARLDAAFESRTAKAFGIVRYTRELEGQADALCRLAGEYEALAVRRTRAARRLTAYLLAEMQTLGEKKIDTGAFVVSRVKNSQPRVDLPEGRKLDTVPDGFRRQPPQPAEQLDKREVLKALRAAGVIPDEAGVYDVELEGAGQFQVEVTERIQVK